jgi:flagellar biosynthesis protein FlhF
MNEATTAENGLRTYRGESLEALLPQIREELGPEAVIVRQREGLIGGVGGFFQKRCVEVDAQAGGPGIDLYDEEPEPEFVEEPVPPADEQHVVRNDAATREGLATPAVEKLVAQAQPFAEMLGSVQAEPEPAVEPPAPAAPAKAAELRAGMVACGLGDDLAGEIVDAVVASALPLSGARRLRTLVRNELALRVPVAPLTAPGARTLVMVGPAGCGKSTALAALANAHAAAGTPVARVGLEELPATAPANGLLLVDTPALWGGAEGLYDAARRLRKLKGAEVHLVLRAGIAAPAAAELLEGVKALRPNRLLISGAGETSHLGGVLDLAIRSGVEVAYVSASAGEIAPADPRELAARITP